MRLLIAALAAMSVFGTFLVIRDGHPSVERNVVSAVNESLGLQSDPVLSQLGEPSGSNHPELASLKDIDMTVAPLNVLEALARTARKEKQHRLSQQICGEILKRDSMHFDARVEYQLNEIQLNRSSHAKSELEALLEVQPENVDVLFGLAQIAEKGREQEEEQLYYRKILNVEPNHEHALKALGRLNVSQVEEHAVTQSQELEPTSSGDGSESEKKIEFNTYSNNKIMAAGNQRGVLEYYGQIDPNTASVPVLMKMARVAYDQRQFHFSRGLYRKILQRDPSHLSARIGYQLCEYDVGDPKKAIDNLKDLERKHPGNSELQAALSHASARPGTLEPRSVRTVKNIPKPESVRVRYQNAMRLARQDRFKESLKALTELISPSRSTDYVVHDYIVISNRIGEDKKALEQLGRVDPKTTPVYVLEALAESAFNQKEFEDAYRLYGSIIEREPDHLNAKISRQRCLAEAGSIHTAERNLDKLAKSHPKNVDVISGLASIAALRGETNREWVYYEEILSIQPEHKDARDGLQKLMAAGVDYPMSEIMTERHEAAVALAHKDRLEDSLVMLTELMSETQNRAVLNDYIVISTWAGKDKQAVKSLEKVDPKTSPTYVVAAIAKSARNLRRYSLSEELYNEILLREPENDDAKKGIEAVKNDRAAIRSRKAAQKKAKKVQKPVSPLASLKGELNTYPAPSDPLPLSFKREHEQALALAESGDMAESFRALDALYTKTRHSDVLYSYIDYASRDGKNKQALSHLNKVNPRTAPFSVLISLAQSARAENQLKTARELYGSILRRDPNHLDAKIGLQVVKAETGQIESADHVLKSLVTNHPQNTRLLSALATVQGVKGDPFSQRDYFHRVLEIDPENEDARTGVASLAHLPELPDSELGAEPLSNRVLTEDNRLRYRYASALADSHRLGEAFIELESLVGLTDEPSVIYDYVKIASKTGRHEEALSAINRMDLNFAPTDVIEAMALSARTEKRQSLSKVLNTALLERRPGNLQSEINARMIAAEAGDVVSAELYLKSMLRTHPKNPDLFWGLARISQLKGDKAAEKNWLQMVLELNPRHKAARRALRRLQPPTSNRTLVKETKTSTVSSYEAAPKNTVEQINSSPVVIKEPVSSEKKHFQSGINAPEKAIHKVQSEKKTEIKPAISKVVATKIPAKKEIVLPPIVRVEDPMVFARARRSSGMKIAPSGVKYQEAVVPFSSVDMVQSGEEVGIAPKSGNRENTWVSIETIMRAPVVLPERKPVPLKPELDGMQALDEFLFEDAQFVGYPKGRSLAKLRPMRTGGKWWKRILPWRSKAKYTSLVETDEPVNLNEPLDEPLDEGQVVDLEFESDYSLVSFEEMPKTTPDAVGAYSKLAEAEVESGVASYSESKEDWVVKETIAPVAMTPEIIEERHQYAISLARTNSLPESIRELESLLEQTDWHEAIFNDYVLVLSWASRDKAVLKLLDRIDAQVSPDYVVSAVAGSARNLKEFAVAKELFNALMTRNPQDLRARIDYHIVDAESGYPERAIFELEKLRSVHPKRVDILTGLAHAAKVKHDTPLSEEYQRKILEIEPLNRDARKALGMIELDLNSGSGDPSSAGAEPAAVSEHSEAVALIREDRLEEALNILACLTDDPHAPEPLMHDYISALAWSGKDVEVLNTLDRINLTKTPGYVLELMAKSARNTSDYGLAKELYRLAIIENPNSIDAHIGRILVNADMGDEDSAYKDLQELRVRHPRHLPLLWTLQRMAANRKDAYIELVCFQGILEVEPDNGAAKRGLIINTSLLGAGKMAIEMLEEDRSIKIPPRTLEKIMGDWAARHVIWGEFTQESPEKRYVETDLALQLLETNLKANRPYGEARLEEVLRAECDRMVALRDRGATAEVIVAYENLEAYHDRLPGYTVGVVADAYLAEGQPDIAKDLYEKALELAPGSFGANLSLYYALLEKEDNGAALNHIETVAKREPPFHQVKGSRVKGQNWRKMTYEMSAHQAQAFGDRLGKSQKRFEEMQLKAPFNTSVRHKLANVYLWRGWPDLAIEHFDVLKALEPKNVEVDISKTNALMQLNRFDEVDLRVHELTELYPERPDVAKLARDWETNRGFAFHTEVQGVEGAGNNVASNEIGTDTYLNGPGWKHWYRAFAHHFFAATDFNEGSVRYQRYGAGARFDRGEYSGMLEVHADEADGGNVGFTAGGDWRPNNYWSFGLSYNSYSNGIPTKGRLDGLEGDEATVSAVWRKSDMQHYRTTVQRQAFNDGNTRESVGVSAFQGLRKGPRYRLFAEVGVYASRNNGGSDVIYFNPEEDFSWNVLLDNYLLNFRKYTRKFNHRLVVNYGQYTQKNFDTDWIGDLRYEHHWDLTDRLGFLYGASRTRRVYDGKAEYATRFHATLNWRF